MKVEFNNLLDIYENIICRNCHNKKKIYNFEKNKMTVLYDLYIKLNNNKYTMGNYNIFLIRRPKHRIVMSLNVTDKIVNHYITLNHIIPTLERYLDNRNIATRKEMGNDYGIKLLKKYLEENKKYDKFYVLKLDIKKYFYNIDHDILKNMIKDKFNSNVFNFICEIIDSTDKEYINNTIRKIKNHELEKAYVDDIKNLPYYNKGKGLPIGNMTSQFFAIYYLSSLDHYIIHDLHIKHYIRYMDDFIIIHNDKDYLRKCKKLIENKLINEYKLELNQKSKIFDSVNGFDFLGYNFKVIDKKTIMRISNKSYNYIKHNIKCMNNSVDDFGTYVNYYNSFKYCNNCKIKYLIDKHYEN